MSVGAMNLRGMISQTGHEKAVEMENSMPES
jgi:hypothetical protein